MEPGQKDVFTKPPLFSGDSGDAQIYHFKENFFFSNSFPCPTKVRWISSETLNWERCLLILKS